MRTVHRAAAIVLALTLLPALTGCEGLSLEPRFGLVPRFGPEPKRAPLAEAASAAQKTAEDVRRAAQARLEELDRELARLRRQAQRHGGEARDDVDAQVQRLEATRRDLQRRLDASGDAGKAALEKIAGAIDDALEEVARAGE